MKKTGIILCLALLAFSWNSCKKCGNKMGKEADFKAYLGPYHSISVKGKFEIELSQDSAYYIEATGGEGLLKNITYNVVDSVLTIENLNTCSFLKNYEDKLYLKIGCAVLKELTFENPYRFYNLGSLKSNSLKVVVQECAQKTDISGEFNNLWVILGGGSANLTIGGVANEVKLENTGTGQIHAEKLIANKVETSSRGTGSIYSSPVQKINANIIGSGNSYYTGNAAASVTIYENATGRLIKL
ncbi:MAG: DUF2807 domain-containing protein [Flavobacteriales bacterium]|nr:DUF2807 domain-containing protein [Flavobacteriales bacterium]